MSVDPKGKFLYVPSSILCEKNIFDECWVSNFFSRESLNRGRVLRLFFSPSLLRPRKNGTEKWWWSCRHRHNYRSRVNPLLKKSTSSTEFSVLSARFSVSSCSRLSVVASKFIIGLYISNLRAVSRILWVFTHAFLLNIIGNLPFERQLIKHKHVGYFWTFVTNLSTSCIWQQRLYFSFFS